MFWLRANYVDSKIKKAVLDRSGGYCECSLPEHNHVNMRCGNRLGLQHYFFSIADNTAQSATDVIVLCPVCYREAVSKLIPKF